MKRIRYLFVVLTLVLLGHPAFAALPPGDLFVVPAGDLEQALGTVIAEAQTQLEGGAGADELFASPAFLTVLLGLLGSVSTYFATNGFKLSSSWFRGNRTRILAAVIAMISAGVPAYFTVTQVSGVETAGGIAAAVAAALGALRLAIGAHETKRQQQTGQRLPDRKGLSPTAQLTVMGLKALAQNLGLPGAAFIVDALLTDHNIAQAEQIIKNMARERALTGEEIDAHLDAYEEANVLTPAEMAAARAKLAKRQNRAVAVAPAG